MAGLKIRLFSIKIRYLLFIAFFILFGFVASKIVSHYTNPKVNNKPVPEESFISGNVLAIGYLGGNEQITNLNSFPVVIRCLHTVGTNNVIWSKIFKPEETNRYRYGKRTYHFFEVYDLEGKRIGVINPNLAP